MNFNNREDREDFEQTYDLKRLEHRRATRRQLYIDFVRSEMGYPNRKNFKMSKQHYFTTDTIDRFGDKKDIDRLLDIKHVIDKLSGIDRIIVALKIIWELEYKEIGYCFDLSEGRICQIFQDIVNKIGREHEKNNKKIG